MLTDMVVNRQAGAIAMCRTIMVTLHFADVYAIRTDTWHLFYA